MLHSFAMFAIFMVVVAALILSIKNISSKTNLEKDWSLAVFVLVLLLVGVIMAYNNYSSLETQSPAAAIICLSVMFIAVAAVSIICIKKKDWLAAMFLLAILLDNICSYYEKYHQAHSSAVHTYMHMAVVVYFMARSFSYVKTSINE